jgi:hypothetical protein
LIGDRVNRLILVIAAVKSYLFVPLSAAAVAIVAAFSL